MRRRLVIACTIVLASIPRAASSAPAEIPLTDRERPYAERAAQKMADDDWEGVATVLKEGYEATGSLRLLAGWARAEKEAGDCAESLRIYERFFASNPTPEQRESVQPHVEACRASATTDEPSSDGARPAAQLDSGDDPILPGSVEPRSPTRDEQPVARRWQRDVLGGVLVGTGAAVLLVGAGLAIGAEIGDARVDSEPTHGGFESRLQRAQGLAYGSYAAFAVGGALAIGGVARYVLVARRGRRVGVALLPGGAVVAIAGRFSLF